MEPAKKFQNQLRQIFSKPGFDLEFVNERVQAAYDYFFKTLDNLVYTTLKQIAELGRKSKTKSYLEELQEIDELQTEAVIKLKKVKLMVQLMMSGRPFTKEDVWSSELKNYKLAKIAKIQHEKRENKSLLDLDDEPIEEVIPLKVSKKDKQEKRSTYLLTLDLIQEGYTIEQIARQRQLSENTINNHIINLIKAEKIELKDVMDEERIRQLEDFFDGYSENSLTPLKDKLGDKVTWDELKLFRASTII
jgi:uncharacterized protein YpbB